MIALTDLQSALAPAGEQAARIAQLWWVFLWVLTAVFVIVASFLFFAILRSRREPRESAAELVALIPEEGSERRASRIVIAALIATVAILFALLLYDFFTGRAIYAITSAPDPLIIKVTGHQWWWEVEYENEAEPSKMLTTSNELHVPVGKAVKLELQSVDVIHSFWVPNLQGKKDLIPGHPTETWLKADRTGTFRGQCAEFCGHQHAHMRFTLVANSPAQFESWMNSQRADAPEPSTDSARRGREVFLSSQCAMCHAISGTNARATVGPDLTHIASRDLTGAAIRNTRGYLAGWILNPQNIKPGARMPTIELSADDLNALLEYLESLK